MMEAKYKVGDKVVLGHRRGMVLWHEPYGDSEQRMMLRFFDGGEDWVRSGEVTPADAEQTASPAKPKKPKTFCQHDHVVIDGQHCSVVEFNPREGRVLVQFGVTGCGVRAWYKAERVHSLSEWTRASLAASELKRVRDDAEEKHRAQIREVEAARAARVAADAKTGADLAQDCADAMAYMLHAQKDSRAADAAGLERLLMADESGQPLHESTDAQRWAVEFCKLNTSSDQGTMISWFANAIEAGRNAGRAEVKRAVLEALK